MGRTYRKGGREADHKRRREAWKRQKGTKREKETEDGTENAEQLRRDGRDGYVNRD